MRKRTIGILLILMVAVCACAASASDWTCPACGTENTGNFCTNCGAARPHAAWTCPACGAENTGNFCTNCGAARPHAAWTCPACGAENTGTFCGNCGAARPSEAPEETVPPKQDADALFRRGMAAAKAGDYVTAAEYYRLAANQGSAAAQNDLGLLYNSGNGVEQSYEKAAEYFRLAADQGFAVGQNNIGVLYELGNGVEQSYEKAAEYYRLAADQGYAGAQKNLGCLYKSGKGVEQSYEKAAEYFRLAADQGFVEAQQNLGWLYVSGKGVEQSYEKAAEYFRLAADQGYAAAQNDLGVLYESGKGVEQSYEKAEMYYQLAADQGSKDGAGNLARLREALSAMPEPTAQPTTKPTARPMTKPTAAPVEYDVPDLAVYLDKAMTVCEAYTSKATDWNSEYKLYGYFFEGSMKWDELRPYLSAITAEYDFEEVGYKLDDFTKTSPIAFERMYYHYTGPKSVSELMYSDKKNYDKTYNLLVELTHYYDQGRVKIRVVVTPELSYAGSGVCEGQQINAPDADGGSDAASATVAPSAGGHLEWEWVNVERRCPSCLGSGTCPICHGTGYITMYGQKVSCDKKCSACGGSGSIIQQDYQSHWVED